MGPIAGSSLFQCLALAFPCSDSAVPSTSAPTGSHMRWEPRAVRPHQAASFREPLCTPRGRVLPRQRHFINIRPRDAPSRPRSPGHLARPARTPPETTLIASAALEIRRAHNPHRTGHGFGRKCDAAHSSRAPRSPRPLPESARRNFNRLPWDVLSVPGFGGRMGGGLIPRGSRGIAFFFCPIVLFPFLRLFVGALGL